MIEFIGYLILSFFLTWGFTITFVEKGDEYPIKRFKDFLRKILEKCISKKFSEILNCETCFSFWISFFSDGILYFVAKYYLGGFYFFWPLSGFIFMGITWFLIEFLNVLDNKNFTFNNEDNENEDK